jgi:hypothetical protein
MDNISNTQTNRKTLWRSITLISAVVLVLSMSFSYAFGAPPHWGWKNNYNCTYNDKTTLTQKTCCWHENVEPGTGNPNLGGNQEIYCQTCSNIYQGNGNYAWECDSPELQFRTGATTDQPISPTNDIVLDEQQQSKPILPLTDQSIPQGNLGTLEPQEDSSNNENSETENSVSSDNPGFSNVEPQNPDELEQQTTDDSNNDENAPLESGDQR